MSRSALWRQEKGVKDRECHANEVFQIAVEEGKQRSQKGLVTITKDETFNFNPMLLQNISKSPYFLNCCTKLHAWNALVDEIYYEVKHMEPWTKGHVKTPSTAFCLLLRLFTLRCSEKQMNSMLNHVDSPYIRCIGFMYLRYGANPAEIWDRFHPYLYDTEPVRISAKMSQPISTVGEYVRSLLTDMDYFGTLLPRLPVSVERDIKVKLLQEEKVEERALKNLENKKSMSYFRVGSRIQALYGDEENPIKWYDAIVDRVVRKDDETGVDFIRPKFLVTFPDYGNTEVVSLGEIDMPLGTSAANTELSSEQIRKQDRSSSYKDHRSYSAYRDRSHDTDGSEDRHGYPSKNNHSYGHDRLNHKCDRRSNWKQDIQNDHYQDSQNCSKDLYNSPTRSSRASRYIPNEKDLMEEVLRREREKSAAKGRAYAYRPASFKESITDNPPEYKHSASPNHSSTYYRKRRNDDQDERKAHSGIKQDILTEKATPKKRSTEELATIVEKKRKLLARYG